MPLPPPPPHAPLPAAIAIDVVIDGAPAPRIDAARLGQVAPDFHDEERRAWRLATLLGPAAARPGVQIAVTGERGVSIVLAPTGGPHDPLPVLAVTRRGEVVAAMVEPENPFPDYHGRGGRLGRPGDPLPRISGVTNVKVTSAAAP